MAYDPYFDEAFAEAHGVTRSELEPLIAAADVISLHVPLMDATRNLIDARRIAQMRKGALLINTSRGGLIDEAAAADALATGQLGGIGLDAFSIEPPVGSPLLGLEHVVATPHTGAHSVEAMQKMGMMSVENLRAVLEKRDCPFIIQ